MTRFALFYNGIRQPDSSFDCTERAGIVRLHFGVENGDRLLVYTIVNDVPVCYESFVTLKIDAGSNLLYRSYHVDRVTKTEASSLGAVDFCPVCP